MDVDVDGQVDELSQYAFDRAPRQPVPQEPVGIHRTDGIEVFEQLPHERETGGHDLGGERARAHWASTSRTRSRNRWVSQKAPNAAICAFA